MASGGNNNNNAGGGAGGGPADDDLSNCPMIDVDEIIDGFANSSSTNISSNNNNNSGANGDEFDRIIKSNLGSNHNIPSDNNKFDLAPLIQIYSKFFALKLRGLVHTQGKGGG